jgi:hypothetical protein
MLKKTCPLVLLLIAMASPRLLADEPAQEPPLTSMPSGMVYADYNYGFKLILPPATLFEYDRTRFHDWKDSIGLLRGRTVEGRHSLQIVIFRSYEMPGFNDWVNRFKGDLAKGTGTMAVDSRPVPVNDRMGVVLEQRGQLGAAIILTQYLCVPFDQNTVWVFTYSGVANDDQRSLNFLKDSFSQITSTLHVLYNPDEAEKLGEALERGVSIRNRLRAGEIRPSVDGIERFYEISLSGKPIGYLSRRLTQEEHDFGKRDDSKRKKSKRKGLRLRELAWRFAEDGTARRTKLDTFTSDDLRSELIESQTMQIPPPDAAPRFAQIKSDSVVREDLALVSSFSTNMDTKYRDPQPPMGVGPAYMDWAYLRLLPVILPSESKEPIAFVTYDGEKRALITYQVKPLETATLSAEGKQVTVAGYEIREGFAEQLTRIFADQAGTLLRVEAGDLLVTLSTREHIEEQFGKQRAAAELIVNPKGATPAPKAAAPKGKKK